MLTLALALARCGRAIVISIKKKTPEWWDGLTKDKTKKPYVKADFAKFCEEDDPEYHGEFSTAGMEEGGMGGMPGGMGGMPGGMGGMGGMGDMGF